MATRQRIMMISTHGYVAAEPELGKPDTGGQVAYVLELSKCLARMGCQVDILTRQFEDQPKAEQVAERVRVLRFPCGGKEFLPKETLCEHIPEWVANVERFIDAKRLRYAFIDSHYWDAGLAGQMIANRRNIRHIHTPHSIGTWKRDNMQETPEEGERKYNFKKRIREEINIYRECDGLVATTWQQRDILTAGEYGTRPDKIHVVPPGYDDTRFFPVSNDTRMTLKEELGFNGRIVLALGRMAHNKGYDLLIQAMAPVFQRVDDARLVLAIGSTEPSEREQEQIDELNKIANDLGIADRVDFSSFIPDEALADHYRAADVFALCSRYEPFGMTAIEAMACGTPTVLTTEGGLWEQCTWGLEALWANPVDTEAYGHAIAIALQNQRVSEQLSLYGSKKSRADFTWNGIAQQILRITERVPRSATARRQEVEPRPTGSVPDAMLTQV